MNEREYNELRELGWRRQLTSAEQSLLQRYLADHPDAQSDWEAEAALDRLLGRLSDAPLASNFTAQVLQAVDRAPVKPARGALAVGGLRDWIQRLAPRLAWAAGMIAAVFMVWHQHQATQRGRMAQGVTAVLQAASLPGPEVLQDFDAIQQLGQLPPATDVELLNALSQ